MISRMQKKEFESIARGLALLATVLTNEEALSMPESCRLHKASDYARSLEQAIYAVIDGKPKTE